MVLFRLLHYLVITTHFPTTLRAIYHRTVTVDTDTVTLPIYVDYIHHGVRSLPYTVEGIALRLPGRRMPTSYIRLFTRYNVVPLYGIYPAVTFLIVDST